MIGVGEKGYFFISIGKGKIGAKVLFFIINLEQTGKSSCIGLMEISS